MKYTSLEKYNKAVVKEFWIWIIFSISGELKWLLPSKNENVLLITREIEKVTHCLSWDYQKSRFL